MFFIVTLIASLSYGLLCSFCMSVFADAERIEPVVIFHSRDCNINLFHNNFLLQFCGLSSAAISAVGGFLFYPHNRLYRTRHSVCREDVDTEIQHCYSSSFSFAFLTVSIFYQKRCPIKRTLVMTASGHYSEFAVGE